MNSQQELLDAINTISQKQDRSCDTPATVLRVEDDTVWVHIDGGADETPVRKTISCEQGETVQVRISNGSAFLVGNASAPPTDDKTANMAHFVAEQADVKATDANVKATEAKETVAVLEVEVEGKVDSGDSNIRNLSSTMYQNEYGVDIYNDTLAVGDSYAHIDGDSFDIKKVTTAGTIDDENDETIASFGRTSVLKQMVNNPSWSYGSTFSFSPEGLEIEYANDTLLRSWGVRINSGEIIIVDGSTSYEMKIDRNSIFCGANYDTSSWPKNTATFDFEYGKLYILNEIRTGGKITDSDGNRIAPKILESTTISSSTTSYTFTDNAITADSVIDIYDTIFGFTPTAMTVSAGSCTITFPAQSSTHKIKLFVY